MYIPEIKKLQDLLTSFLGEPKNGVGGGDLQMQFPCPRCIEERGHNEAHKYNLEVTLGKDLYTKGGLFHCWSCCSTDDDMKGGVYKLIKMYGNADILKSYKAIIDDMRSTGLYKLPEYKELFGEEVEDVIVRLPSSFHKIESIESTPWAVNSYLKERHFTDDMIKKFGIGYTDNTDANYSFRNRIIVPSYGEDGNLEFWSGRDYTGSKKRPKYYNAPGVDKNDIVYQASHIDFSQDILLVEGALDAVFSPPNTIALLGKILNNRMEVYKQLKERSRGKIIIGLDGDTTIQEIKRIYSVLNRCSMKGRVSYIKMDKYKDMADTFKFGGKDAIISILKDQHTFTELELLI